MAQTFTVNHMLLAAARERLARHPALFWVVGGAGAGKTTICRALAVRLDLPIYDMDAQIYGAYHQRFNPARHPVNSAWASAENGLAWFLGMSWETFNQFNHAALPEYLDLLAEDLARPEFAHRLLIDGGISTPGLLARALPARRIVCLAMPEQTSKELWEGSDERLAMKQIITTLPNPDDAWTTFLEFDRRITATILEECRAAGIAIYERHRRTSVEALVERIVNELPEL